MKKILFLTLLAFVFIGCSSDDIEETWEQKREARQNEVYNKLVANIVGSWKEHMYINFLGNWAYSTEKDYIKEFTFNKDKTATEMRLGRLHTYTYTIEKNPEYLERPGVCCVMILLHDQIGDTDDYSAYIDEDGYLRIQFVTDITGSWLEPDEHRTKFIKQ